MDLRHTYNLKGKLLFSCIGVVCIALGTTVCRVGNVGVDPFTAMNLGLARSWAWTSARSSCW
ncbi:MAG: hypothetical protein V8S24_12575 [Gordonibacter pamelaeae]